MVSLGDPSIFYRLIIDSFSIFSCTLMNDASIQDISKAMHRIRGGIVHSDVKRSHFLSKLCGMEVLSSPPELWNLERITRAKFKNFSRKIVA